MQFIKKFKNINSPEQYEINISDVITGERIKLSDYIDHLNDKIFKLETQIEKLSDRIKILEDENVSTTNEIYRLENSLETRIDILGAEKFVVNENRKTYDELISEGWTMTADGFWIRESLDEQFDHPNNGK